MSLDNARDLVGDSQVGRELAAWRAGPGSPAVPLPLQAPPPPEPWAPRPEFELSRAALLAGGAVASSTTGRGGLGKTALAKKLAADPAVQAAYPDGVFWLELGPQPDVRGRWPRWPPRWAAT